MAMINETLVVQCPQADILLTELPSLQSLPKTCSSTSEKAKKATNR
jgi:hypothetical protein